MDIGLWGYLAPPEAAILGKVLDIKLWGFQAPPGGCYFGKGSGYRALGIFGPSPWPTTSGLDLKFERPCILETSYTKAHFTLGVRAEKPWGRL